MLQIFALMDIEISKLLSAPPLSAGLSFKRWHSSCTRSMLEVPFHTALCK